MQASAGLHPTLRMSTTRIVVQSPCQLRFHSLTPSRGSVSPSVSLNPLTGSTGELFDWQRVKRTDMSHADYLTPPEPEIEKTPDESLPPFVETTHSLALLALVQSQNEVVLNEWAKNPYGATPVLLKRVTIGDIADGLNELEQPEAVVIVDTEAVPPKTSAIAVGPQIGPAIPFMPGFFYATPEAEKDKKFVNGYAHTDGQGQRFKFIMQETQNENGTTNVYYWYRFTCPKKVQGR